MVKRPSHKRVSEGSIPSGSTMKKLKRDTNGRVIMDKNTKRDECNDLCITIVYGTFMPFTPPRFLCRKHYKLFVRLGIIR